MKMNQVMFNCFFLVFICFVEVKNSVQASAHHVTLLTPSVILKGVDFSATIQLNELKNGTVYPRFIKYMIVDEDDMVLSSGEIETLDEEGNYQSHFSHLVHHLRMEKTTGKQFLTTKISEKINPNKNFDIKNTQVFVTIGWVSLFPPIVTLFLSALTGQVLFALVAGIWCGATIVAHGNVFIGFLRTFDTYWAEAFINDDHAGVLLFTIILGGTIGVVQKGGGGHGLAILAKKYMTNSLRMQLSTFLLCILIFFDDYSCILIIGSSLRQVLSQTGVSREKFAAIIHALGVCLPSMAPVSSWIGVEIGYISAQLKALQLDKEWDPFMTCLACIHYRFFPILFIGIIFITILCEKDFGPMVQFEKDAAESPILHPDNSSRSPPLPPSLLYMASSPSSHHQPYTSSISTTTTKELGPLEPDTKKPMRWQNAVLPFGSIVVLTFIGMILDGYQRLRQAHPMETFGLMDALSNCNSVSALIRASAAGWFLAVLMLYSQNIITLEESTKAWLEGVKEILDPTLILILAWALGKVITEVKVAPYIASIIGNEVQKEFLPAITTILCYLVSFATGSGFGTMAIMFPIISPLSWSISHGDRNNLLQCFGSILGGSVFGNTCSPIADTSILTSLSAHIPLENHIKSIMPYALFVAIVSIVFGALPIGFNIFSTFTAFAVSFAVLLFFVFFCGTKVHSRFRALSSASFLSTSPPSKYSLSERYPLIHTAGENE